MDRLTKLEDFIKALPLSRERHAMLEIVGLLGELASKEAVPQEENLANTVCIGDKPKRGRKPSVSLGKNHGA
jgi:hypothetical protein